MAPAPRHQNSIWCSLLVIAGLLIIKHSSAFSMTTPQGLRRALHLDGSEDQVPSLCNPTKAKNYMRLQGQERIEESTSSRQLDNCLISRRDGILRGMVLVAVGMMGTTTTIVNPMPAVAFFDYEGETTDYTYRPQQELGMAAPTTTATITTTQESSRSGSAEARQPDTADERSPGLLDNNPLLSTSYSRVKEYRRLEESEDEWVDPLLTEDSFDGMFF